MKKLLLGAICSMAVSSALAGGYLTNTNLSATFQRNPAREGAIAIDGVYSNPAGVTFLESGLHIQANWQAAFQHRIIDTEYAPFAMNVEKSGTSRHIEGTATAPIIPSILAAYNHERWNIQVMAGLVGGGGKCVFDEGLSSFEQAASMLAILGKDMGITGYGMQSSMRGKQFYLGYQLGAGFKATEHLSVYAGVRATQAICQYYGQIKDIKMKWVNPMTMKEETTMANPTLKALYQSKIEQVMANYNLPIDKAEAIVSADPQGAYLRQAIGLTGDITMNCDQKGLGFAPVIGLDYLLNDQWNFSVKYEFRTKMSLKNRSANEGGEAIPQLQQFADGGKNREDIPAIAAAGIQYSPINNLRFTAGYHLYFDKDAKKYGNKQMLLNGNAWELLLGAEYDINDRLTISCGGQSTNYGNTDAYMTDLAFVTDSYSAGLGIAYKFNENWTLDVAAFKTFYSDYTQNTEVAPGLNKKDVYTRDNTDFGIGLTMNF